MKYRPILMNREMVRAILEDRKTHTRRVIKWESLHKQAGLPFPTKCKLAWFKLLNGWGIDAGDACLREVKCPYGVPGDRLWVRETWSVSCRGGYYGPGLNPETTTIQYAADYADAYKIRHGTKIYGRWKPSIHMPRWASRITLEITDVRVERVQDITEDDCVAEGLKLLQGGIRRAYKILWDSINDKRGFGWDVNPWVWVVEFKKLETNKESP